VRCELVNLSVSGFGTAEQLIALKEEGFRYKPDIVLVAWHRTDVEDNIRSNLYALEQGHLSRKSRVYLPAVTTRARLFRFAAYRWLAGSCHLYCCVRERAARLAKFQVIPTIQRLTQIRRGKAGRHVSCGAGAGSSNGDATGMPGPRGSSSDLERSNATQPNRVSLNVPDRTNGGSDTTPYLRSYRRLRSAQRREALLGEVTWTFHPLGLAKYICEHSLLECRSAL